MEASTHFKNVLLKLNQQRHDNEFCDITLEVEEKQFAAHRSVLAACSQYFYKMFTVNMKEKYQKVVKIRGIKEDAMEEILEFVYCGKIQLNDNNVSNVLEAASIMQVLDALTIVVQFMSDNLTQKNCFFFRNLGKKHSLDNLVEQANQYITNYFDQVIDQNEDIYSLDYDELEVFIKADDLNVKQEKTIFKVLINWVNADVAKRKQHFSSLFQHIRLQFVPLKYLSEKIRKHELVREYPDCRDLIEDAFFYLMSPENFPSQTARKYLQIESDLIALIQPGLPCYAYNVQDKVWTKMDIQNQINSAVRADAAIAVSNHLIAVCGGNNNNGTSSNEAYLLKDERWSRLPAMKYSRQGAAAVFSNEKLLVFGGNCCSSQRGQRTFVTFEEELFEDDETWNYRESNFRYNRYFAEAQVVEERIFLIGGFARLKDQPNQTVQHSAITNTVEYCNLECKNCEEGPSMNHARAKFGSAVLDSKIFVVGAQGVSSPEFLDVKNEVWTLLKSNIPLNFVQASACCVKGQIFAFGTNNKHLFRYNPMSKKWTNENQQVPGTGYIVSLPAQKNN